MAWGAPHEKSEIAQKERSHQPHKGVHECDISDYLLSLRLTSAFARRNRAGQLCEFGGGILHNVRGARNQSVRGTRSGAGSGRQEQDYRTEPGNPPHKHGVHSDFVHSPARVDFSGSEIQRLPNPFDNLLHESPLHLVRNGVAFQRGRGVRICDGQAGCFSGDKPHPPVLIRKVKGRLPRVCGNRRVRECRLKHTQLPVLAQIYTDFLKKQTEHQAAHKARDDIFRDFHRGKNQLRAGRRHAWLHAGRCRRRLLFRGNQNQPSCKGNDNFGDMLVHAEKLLLSGAQQNR